MLVSLTLSVAHSIIEVVQFLVASSFAHVPIPVWWAIVNLVYQLWHWLSGSFCSPGGG